MTHKLVAIITCLASSLAGCAAEPAAPEPTRVYDFSGGSLASPRRIAPPKPGASVKTVLRAAIQEAQPALLGCYIAFGGPRSSATTGTITLSLRLAAERDATLVEVAEVSGDMTEQLATCMRETAMTIKFPPLAEPGIVQVNYPFTVGA